LKGIYISRTSYLNSHLTLDSEEFQGFAIADPMAPLIFINTDDRDTAQLFTLVHELAHVWIGETGISNEVALNFKSLNNIDQVERFCNQVAGIATAKKGKGGPDQHLIQAYRNGHLFSRMVLDAYHGGLIEPVEASHLLGTKINEFSKLEAFVYS